MRKLGIWFLVLLAIIGAASAIYYFIKPAQPNVSLEFTKPDQIFVGKPFILTVSYSNSSEQVLKNSKFSLTLPPEISFVGRSTDQRVMEESLGDVGPGTVSQQNINLIALSGPQTFKRADAKLTYNTGTSNVSFETASSADLALGQPAVSLTVVTPQSAVGGENFDIDIKLQNNTSEEQKNLDLKLSYPPVFKFLKANKDGGINNQEWMIPSLPAGASDELIVNGNLLGMEQSRFQFVANLSTSYMGQTYVVTSQTSETAISASPLSMRASINGTDVNNFIGHAGDSLTYTINYKNNSPVPLSNLILTANLVGAMFDFTTLQTNASFNSLNNILTWTQQNASDLAVLNPGDEKSINFQIKLKNDYPIKRLGDKNFTLKLNSNLESPTVPPGVAAAKTVSVLQAETKISGRIAIKSSGYFYDAGSGILNKGPYPPKANQKTQYTIHWAITNYSDDVTGAVVTANLTPGASFTGTVKSNIDAKPTYDQASGKVTWNVGNVQSAKGILTGLLEAIFQIEYTPSNLDVNKDVPLIGETDISAADVFSGENLTNASPAINSSLPDDQKLPAGNRQVRP